MLLNIRPDLEPSRVFDGLNRLLREAILAALEGRAINQAVLPQGLHDAVEANLATREALASLRSALIALRQEQKDALRAELELDVQPSAFLTDRALPVPTVPRAVFSLVKALSVHLYQRTGKLVDVETACGECIADHYARFRAVAAPGSGNVCCVCGTEYLAQMQAGIGDNEQWRGPYDHLLAKDVYPLYGVHPRNLLPICHTCNSKAKLTKDLLHNSGRRRLSFSPWTERALPGEVQVTIDDTSIFPQVVVSFQSDDANRREKLTTWNEVYKIKERVEGEFRSLTEKVAEDVTSDSEQVFMTSLEQRAQAKAAASRLTPFNYWRARVYRAMHSMDQASREALRSAIQQSRPQAQAMEDLFFN